MMKLFIITLCSLYLLTDVFGASYYVSPTGSDSADGLSPATAWQTLSRANTQSFIAGDALLFEGGQTFNGELELRDDDTGTASNPILVSSYGIGKATINAVSDTSAIDVYNTDGIKIYNIKATGNWNSVTQTGNTQMGISFFSDLSGSSTSNYVYIDNVESSGFRHGIAVGHYSSDMSKGHFDDITIVNSLAHDNARDGIILWSNSATLNPTIYGYTFRNVLIRNCKAYSNEGETAQSFPTGFGINLEGVQNATVEHCITYNNGIRCGGSGGGAVGIMPFFSDNVTIQFCESYNNKAGPSTTDGGGFDLDGGCTNSTVQYCYSHDNDGAGYLIVSWDAGAAPCGTNTIRYNVSENDCRKSNLGALSVLNGANDSYVYNNTVYIEPSVTGLARGMYIWGEARSRVYNNLIQSTGAMLVETGPSQTLNYNNYQSSGNLSFRHNGTTYKNFAAFVAASGYETNGKTDRAFTYRNLSYPQMPLVGTIGDAYNLASIRAYRLQPTSPMIDAGLNISSLFPLINMGIRDFWGNAIPVNGLYDIGAHETAKLVGQCTVSN